MQQTKFDQHMDGLVERMCKSVAGQHPVEVAAACCIIITATLETMHPSDRVKIVPEVKKFIRTWEESIA